MSKRKLDLGLRIVKGLFVLLATVPFLICWFYYYVERFYAPFYDDGHMLVVVLFVVLAVLSIHKEMEVKVDARFVRSNGISL